LIDLKRGLLSFSSITNNSPLEMLDTLRNVYSLDYKEQSILQTASNGYTIDETAGMLTMHRDLVIMRYAIMSTRYEAFLDREAREQKLIAQARLRLRVSAITGGLLLVMFWYLLNYPLLGYITLAVLVTIYSLEILYAWQRKRVKKYRLSISG
jgi:hypothetical protein